MHTPGNVVLFGSGETSTAGQKVFHRVFTELGEPVRAAILETPAGFQPNSAKVAQEVADFLLTRLVNFAPQVTVVPARERGTAFSPDEPQLLVPLHTANLIYLGAGSPTYAVRQLQDSLAWHTLLARQRRGATVVMASAAVLAASAQTLPVYEIYKVGEALHWLPGLDLFGAYGLSLAFAPHWNNTDGGDDLDTGHCFMGQVRFERLQALLPARTTVVGIDEHTTLTFELAAGCAHVEGRGSVVVITPEGPRRFENGQTFELGALGPFHLLADPAAGLPADVWAALQSSDQPAPVSVPTEVTDLLQARETARHHRDWAAADRIRDQIRARGWQVQDTPAGPQAVPC